MKGYWVAALDGSRCVLGIDVACRRWNDIGSALIKFRDQRFTEVFPGAITWPSEDLSPAAVARAVDAFARRHGVAAVSMDGPHAWRDPAAPSHRPGVGRVCEYTTRTPGKTGPRGVAYPSTFLRWIHFSIDVFAALLRRPDVALFNDGAGEAHPRPAGYWLSECFPTSTWRTSGLAPLPGHRRAPPDVVEQFARRLMRAFDLPASAVTRDHDNLQAVVAALSAVGLLGGPVKAYARGEPARSVGGVLVEGFIWDAAPAGRPIVPVAVPRTASTVSSDERDTARQSCVERGAALFRDLVRRANEGEAIGISYKGFVEHVHGVPFATLRAGSGPNPTSLMRCAWPTRLPMRRAGSVCAAVMLSSRQAWTPSSGRRSPRTTGRRTHGTRASLIRAKSGQRYSRSGLAGSLTALERRRALPRP